MKSTGIKNSITMLIFTIALGAFAGAVLWIFLKAVSLCTELCWVILPGGEGNPAVTIVLCAAGGLALGATHRKFGNYPDDMNTVFGKIKREKRYDYRPMPAILICAFIPLVLGASVGPEAAMVGIIAALCYWIGDNVTFAKHHASEYTGIGEAVTLGQLFHSPLFGIFMVEEEQQGSENGQILPKPQKLLYYGVSTAASFLVVSILNHLFGKAMGAFPSFSDVSIEAGDYLMMLVYVPIGSLMYFWFEFSEKLTHKAALKVPDILREVIGGAAIAVTSLLLPQLLFSGEEEMAELMDTFGLYTPVFLIVICVLKVLMTSFCIQFGWKGGHFFPLIFACSCIGFALPMLFFAEPASHVVFGAGVVTAATLGAQIRKPLAVTILLLLCFPIRMIFWIFLAAVAGSRLVLVVKKAVSKTEE